MPHHKHLWSAFLAVLILLLAVGQGMSEQERDGFYWLGEFNKAAVVMLVEENVIDADLGRKIAGGVAKVLADGEAPGAERPNVIGYLKLEKQLIAAAGPEASRIHSGRSRQDLFATQNRVVLRDDLLKLYEGINDTRAMLSSIAEENIDTIIPAYTNGVQAQPITFAHYLLAFEAALSRDAERLRQSYGRVNLSPLGAAALGTSSFPINRPRLAELLGFDGVVENSYDANLVSSMDVPLEVIHVIQGTALTVGALIEDIVAQYRGLDPWLLLRRGKLTGSSSIMPQKRNPYGLMRVRKTVSSVVGEAITFVVQAHNVSPGMLDYKLGQVDQVTKETNQMLKQLQAVLQSLVVNKARAQAEVDAEYSTTTELANILQRESDVPFRVGHHFASELVSFGRSRGLKPADIPYTEAQRIYAETAAHFKRKQTGLPLSEERFHQSLSARNMVESSQGLGGPNPREVRRMLGLAEKRLATDRSWLTTKIKSLDEAQKLLDKSFQTLRGG